MTKSIFSLLAVFTLFFNQHARAQSNEQIEQKLRIISHLTVNDEYISLPEDSILRKYLKVELITEDQYLARKKTRVNFLVADTLKYRKKNGLLKLPATTGSKTFRDILEDNDGRVEYQYLGHYPFLNSYLVESALWEEMNYTLYSKKNGSELGTFSSMPYVSPDKKKILTAYADPYETDCEIGVYMVTNGKAKNSMFVRFHNWMPGPDAMIFWSSDGKLYLPFQFSENFWNEEGNFNTNYRYLRITLL